MDYEITPEPVSGLDSVLAEMSTGYIDLDLFAKGQHVDAKEVADKLATVDPDTAIAVCLRVLAKYAG